MLRAPVALWELDGLRPPASDLLQTVAGASPGTAGLL